VKYFGINFNNDDSRYDAPPRRIAGLPPNISPQDEINERISHFNEKTLSSSKSLHADIGEEDENVTRVHSLGPSPSRTQNTTPTIQQVANQMFDYDNLAQNGTGNGGNGNCNETRPATPTSSVFEEHKDGV